MAWIRKHAGARGTTYRVHWRDPEGRERSRTFHRRTGPGGAEAFAREIEGSKDRGSYRDPKAGRETVGAFWAHWIDQAEANDRPSERTRIAYEEVWRRFVEPRLGAIALNRVARGDVRQVVADAAKVSAWRANDALKVSRMLLNCAVDEELIVANPATRVQAPRIELAEPDVLTPDEVERIVRAVPEQWRALVQLLFWSSLRWSEAIALRVDRLDLMRRRVRVEEKIVEHGHLMRGEPKTEHSRRAVAIPEFVALDLAEHVRRWPPSPDGLVFHQGGSPVGRSVFRRMVWLPALVAAKMRPFPIKNARHTGASLAIAAGANPKLVAARLGHTSTRMVDKHYVSLFEGLDRDIARELDRMHTDRRKTSKRLRPTRA